MDSPNVRYTTSFDGTRIAYAVLGGGPGVPLVKLLQPWYAHIPLDTQQIWSDMYDALSARRQLIVVSPRGAGLSDRDVSDRSADAFARDLLAVADAARLSQFAIWVHGIEAAVATALARLAPDRVDRLVLFDPDLRGNDLWDEPRELALRAIAEFSWEAFAETYIYFSLGSWDHTAVTDIPGVTMGDHAHAVARLIRRSLTAEGYLRFVDSSYSWDTLSPAADARCPALCISLHVFRRSRVAPDAAPVLASALPAGTLATLPTPHSARPILQAFLDEADDRSTTVVSEAAPSAFQTIMFTDLESSTALTQRLGDHAAQEVLRGHNATVRAALEAHGGREVKHTGDGIMAAFPSAVRAVEAALQIQRDLAGGEVRVRVGLNAGEPIAEDDDLFGTAVQLAARICDRAEPGQVLVSRVVADLCAGKRLQFTHHSDATLKGFAEPVALYEVGV